MKKILLVFLAFLMSFNCAMAQLGRGQQFQNNNFENWTQYGSVINRYYMPDHWNSLKNASGDWASATSVVLYKENGNPSGSGQYCAKLQSKSILGVVANGGITNGRFNAGSTDAGNSLNCTYTNTQDANYHTVLTSKPDSIYFWAKTDINSGTQSKARCNIVIHNNVVTSGASFNAAFQDPGPSDGNSIVNTDANGNNAKIVAAATSNFLSNGGWSLRKIAFDYDSYVNNNTEPSFILATFATSNTPGGGSDGDKLYIDDVVLIYNTRLASLNVNGASISNFNADVTTYNTSMCAGAEFPTITFNTQSSRATGTITHAATTSEPYTTIRVNHYNQANVVYTDYTINYHIIPSPAAPTVASSNVNKCYGETAVLSATPSTDCAVRWYDSESSVNILSTGNNYLCNENTNTTYYASSYNTSAGCESASRTAINVVVNPKPEVPSVTGNSRCGVGDVTLNATPGANGSSCQWYANATGGSTLGSATSFTTPSLSATTTYYVSSISEYGCESDRTSVTATINGLPQAATVTPNSRCGAGTVELSATVGTDGDQCRWYANAEGGEVLSTGNSFVTPNLETTTTYYVSSYSSTTGCESSSRTPVTATVKTIPTAPVTNNGSRCGEGSVNLSVTADATPYTYNWYDGEGVEAQLLASGISYTTGNINTTTTYFVDATNNGCTSTRSAVQAIINAAPAAPSAQNQVLCGPGNTVLTAQPAESCECRWYNASHNIISTGISSDTKSLSVNNINTTSTYYVTSLNTTTQCASAETAITVSVAAVPGNATASSQARCGEGAITLTATAGSNANTCRWYDSSATLLYTGTNFEIEDLEYTSRYTVKSYNTETGCEGAERGVIATVNPIPTEPTVLGTQSICGNGNTTLYGTAGSNANNCQWILGNDTTTATSFTTANLTAPESISYTVRSINTTTQCTSEGINISVTANSVPAAPVATGDAQCQGAQVTLHANSGANEQCRWYASAESSNILSTENDFHPSDLTVGTTNFYVCIYNTNTSCEGSRSMVQATVYPTYNVEDEATACDSYTWNGETFTESGNYTHTLTSIHSCDSVVTLHLTINNSKQTHIDTTVCDVFVWNSVNYTESNPNLVDTFFTSKGCDSIVSINLTVKHKTYANDSRVVCSNELPFEYNGTQIPAAGNYTIILTNAQGCDSVISLAVTVNAQPAVATNLVPATRCGAGNITLSANPGANGTSCRWYDSATAEEPCAADGNQLIINNLQETKTYYVSSFNAYTANGHACESGRSAIIATINTVPAQPDIDNEYRCGAGEVTFTASIDENTTTCRWYPTATASTSDASGLSYTVSISNINEAESFYAESWNESTGCKSSRVEVTATAHAIPSTPVLAAMSNCGAHSFSINAPSAGYYKWYDNATSEEVLSIVNNTTPVLTESRSYFISNSIDYTDISCESGRGELALTIYPVYDVQNLYDTLCQGDTYTQYGLHETFTQAGSFVRTLSTTSSHGCDSVVTLHLWVKEIKNHAWNHTACDTYTWNDETYNQSGSYIQHFTSSLGCDSVVTLNLTINYSKTNSFNATACNSYEWNEETYTESGDYTQHFNTSLGCDSAVTLHLTINNSKQIELNKTACDEYVWNSQVYTTSGTYIQYFQTVKGCDSTVTLNLTVNYSDTAIIDDEICYGETYTLHNFNVTPSSIGLNTYTHLDQKVVTGCDSTTILRLQVNPVYNQTVTQTICETALPYTWNDTTYQIGTPSGEYTHTYSTYTTAGCDSIITLNLTISNKYVTHLSADICQGASYTFGGRILTESGTYYDSLLAHNFCDSIVELQLRVHELHTTNLFGEICLGESYNQFGFNITPEVAGQSNHQRIIQTSFGCDSTINLSLTTYPTYNYTETAYTCDNSAYIWQGHEVEIGLKAAGTYIIWDSLTTTHGCDSVYKLTLTVNPTYNKHIDTTVCDVFVWNETTYTESAVLNHTYTLATGCDSVVTINLTVNHSVTTNIDTTVCDSFIFPWEPAQPYTQSISKSHTYQTALGCDSTVTINATINHSVTEEVSETICQSQLPYQWRDKIFEIGTTSGQHIYQLHSYLDCDSTVTFNLTVNPTYFYSESATTCDNEAYVWAGHEVEIGLLPAGDYIFWDSLSTVNECDSVYKLELTVNATSSSEFDVEICEGEVYNYNGRRYSVAGDYPVHFNNAAGCDSTVTLHLTVHPKFEADTMVTICQGALPYSFADSIFTEAGTKDIRLHTIYGCDSIYHVTLHVNAFITHTQQANVCDNELPYILGDSSFYTSGNYTVIETHEDGCNEYTYLTLTVNPTYEYTETAVACGSYILTRGATSRVLTQSGIYSDTLATIHGCDSIIHLNLTINPLKDSVLTPVICLGSSYSENGFNITPTEAGIVLDTLSTSCVGTDCDSTVYLILTVNPSYNISFDTTVCDAFVWNETTYTESALLNHTYTLTTGCDSIVNINLTVNHSVTTDIDTTVCDAFVFPWNPSQVYTESTSQTYVYQTVLGCDSTVNISVTINHSVSEEASETICQSQLPYTWRDTTFEVGSVTGIYTFDRKTSLGCDSTVTLTLTINPNNHYTDNNIYFCQGSFVYWRGQQIAAAGLYTDTVENEYGCYDVYQVTAIQNPSYTFTERDTICPSELPYLWRGNTYTAAGTYDINYYTANQCDSIYVLELAVRESYMFNDTDAVCEGENYIWQGHEHLSIGMMTPGTHVIWDSLATAFGCDSLYRLTLTVYPSAHEIEQASNCSNEAPYQWHGMSISMTGTYRDTLSTVNGCDSICILNFTLLEPTSYVFNDTTCENHAYSYAGFEWAMPVAGDTTMIRTIDNSVGCDSTITLHLNVMPSLTNSFDTIACTVFIWNTQTYLESGDYQQTFTAYNGCDSVVTLHLTIDTPEIDTVYATSCDVYEWNGTSYTQSGVYSKTFTQEIGCDNTSYLVLTINNSTETTINDTICLGEHYQAWGFDTIPTNAGITRAEQHLSTVQGCDSLVKLELIVKMTYIESSVASTCDNEPYQWRGHTCDTAGIYIDQYEAVNHCDSIFILQLTVYPTYSQDVTDTAVVGVHYTRYGMDFTPTAPGVQHFDIPEVTVHNCDSIISLTLVIVEGSGIEQTYLNKAISVYPNPAEELFTVSSTAGDISEVSIFDNSGRLVMKRTINDQQAQIGIEELAAGMYIVRVRTADGIANKKLIVK